MTRPGEKLSEARRLKTNASSRAWKQRNRERVRDYERAYAATHPEFVAKKRERARAHYWENRDSIRAVQNASRIAKPVRYLLNKARERAKAAGLPFALQEQDIHIPDRCPLLGIALQPGRIHGQPHSPTVDRIDPSLGYVPGNVWVISYRANRIKNDASLEELRMIVAGLSARLAG
jgi:hypothetical protein